MTDRAAALWLDVLGGLVAAVSHEVNNSLNGIAVNLAVVTSRLAGPSTGGDLVSRTAPFAEKATAQFELANELIQSVVALVRPAAADPRKIVGPLAVVAGAAVARHGKTVSVVTDEPVLPADGQVVRLAIGAALLTAVRESASCSVTWIGRDVQVVRTEPCAGAAMVPTAVAEVVRAAGLDLRESGDTVTFTFL